MGKERKPVKETNVFLKKELRLSKKKKNLIGIDIGSENLKLVEVKSSIPKKVVSAKLPDGVIVDGKIEAGPVISEVIKTCIKNHKMTEKKCSFAISSNEMIVREFKMPMMDEKNLIENINTEIANILPMSLENFCIDYKVLETIRAEESFEDMLRLMVVAVPLYVVKEYVAIAKKAGLTTEYIDVYPSIMGKLEKWIMSNSDGEPDNVCYIDFGANMVKIAIYKKGTYVLHKNIQNGGKNLSSIIASDMGIAFSNADGIKKDISLSSSSQDKDSFEYVKDYYDKIISEIDSMLYYYKTINNNFGVSRIYISGAGSRMNGLVEYMEKQLYVEVLPIAEKLNVFRIKDINPSNLDEFTCAIASTMREEWVNV